MPGYRGLVIQKGSVRRIHGRPTYVPAVLDPTYADRDVTINPGENWQTKINGQSAGTAENPIIFGVTAGTHVRADALGANPKDHHWFVGESDGVPTAQFPNGSPISLVDGQRFSGPGSDLFLCHTAEGTPKTGVKIIMLEIDGFAPPGPFGSFIGGNTVDWYYSHINQHHCSEGAFRLGAGAHMRYCWVHHNGRDGMTANAYYLGNPATNINPTGNRLSGIIVEHTTCDYNNQLEYAPNVSGSHAGGTKFLATDGMIVRYCDFSRNGGPGLWWDGGSTGTHVHHNTVHDNILGSRSGSGIFYEINDAITGALIEHNDVRRNGDAANIHISTSRGTAENPIIVRNNYTEEHPQWEIIVDNNGSRAPGSDHTIFENNTCKRTVASAKSSRFLTGAYTSGGAPLMATKNLHWEGNEYIWDPGNLGHSNPFLRDTSGVSWSTWNGLGHDDSGSYVEV